MFKFLKIKIKPVFRITNKGFTLIETLVAIGIFSIIALSMYFSYSNILDVIISSQANNVSLSVMDNELEIIRNMKYEDVGVQGGAPAGKLLAEKTVQQSGASFLVKTYVRNIDDPFDGTIGGSPNDLAPADYRLVELELTCPSCPRFSTRRVTTLVAPLNLESASKNGSLFINVFDSSGQPLNGANIHVINNSVIPTININDTSSLNGMLQLVDIATSSVRYEVTVTKSGYSSDRTYTPGDLANPHPLKPHATVAKQQLTQISFAIDKVSTINLKTADQMCVAVPDIDYFLSGSKLIGTDPDVLKYSTNSATDSNGTKVINNLEWDTYSLQNLDSQYYISAMASQSPLIVNSGSLYNQTWVMGPKDPSALLLIVQDQNGNSINDASIQLTKSGFDQTIFSGHKFAVHTNWAGPLNTTFKTSNLETDNPSGQITVKFINNKYATSSEELISSTVDFGTSITSFYNLSWNPISQPAGAGANSLKFQIATNNDNLSWNFVGPDGTADTFYTLSGTEVNPVHNSNRYLRYKIYMKTLNDQFTPQLNDLSIEFHSSCTLDGQAYFSGLNNATYTLNIQKAGYQTFTDPAVNINSNWRTYKATLIP